MDEFERIADRYFKLIEGRDLYPTLRTWHWYLWIATLVIFVYGLSYTSKLHSSLIIVLLEAPFLACCGAVEFYKRRQLQVRFGLGKDGSPDLKVAHRRALEQVCGLPATEFGKLAKECADLRTLSRAFPRSVGLTFSRFKTAIYDRDSKARLLALCLAALATFVTLLNRSLSDQTFDLMGIVADEHIWQFIGMLWTVLVVLFFVWIGIIAGIEQLGFFLRIWWARVSVTTVAKDVALTYLISDLVRYHQPSTQSRGKPVPRHRRVKVKIAARLARPRRP